MKTHFSGTPDKEVRSDKEVRPDKEVRMDLQHLRTLKRSGQLHDAAISPFRDGHGWLLTFHDNKGDAIHLTTSAGGQCCFHNLDRASQAAREIGFDEPRIVEQ